MSDGESWAVLRDLWKRNSRKRDLCRFPRNAKGASHGMQERACGSRSLDCAREKWPLRTGIVMGYPERSFDSLCSLRTGILIGFLVNHNPEPYPVFFVSVASKGLSRAVSLLFATLAGRSISVAAKGLKAIVGSDLDRVPTGSGSSR